MKRPAAMLLVVALLPICGGIDASSGIAVDAGKTTTLSVTGATDVYSVDPAVAQAGLADGLVHVRGVGGGTTTIVVVMLGGQQTFNVTVTSAQLAASLGADQNGGSASQAEGLSDGGSYEGTYNSGGGELTNAFEFHRQQGTTFRQLRVVAATGLSANSNSVGGSSKGTGFPLISYEVKAPGRDITYLDQEVTTSPLGLQYALVRGIHLQEGPWIFHAGASSVAGFGPYFVLTNPQWVAGATRAFALSPSSVISANLYDIMNGSTSTNGGFLGSLLYTYQPKPHFVTQAELGVSHGIGFAASTAYDDKSQHLYATLLDKPATFASLASSAQQGLFGTLDYARAFNQSLSGEVDAQQSNYVLPAFRSNSESAQGQLTYRLSRQLSLTGGALYTSLDSIAPVSFQTRSLALPISMAWSSGRLSAGLQYQPTTNFTGSTSTGYGANLGFNQGPFSISGSFTHSVDIPTLASIFSEVPGLQAALEQAGINVTDPSQLAALLNNAALLASLGFTGLRLNVSPAQNVFALNAQYATIGPSRSAWSLGYTSSHSALPQGAFTFALATLAYQRRLTASDDVILSASLLKNAEVSGTYVAGSGTVSANQHTSQMTYGVSIHHRFGAAPAFLFPEKRGDIQGFVFRDDEATGEFSHGDSGMGGVTVTLDGGRTATTDANGHYLFVGVPYGQHQIAAQIATKQAYYFTTASPATASIGSTVDFGVSFVQGKIFGYVTNDAGQGIGGVVVRVQGSDKHATTEEDGRFVIEGLPKGSYLMMPDPDTFPTGYDLSKVTPVRADVNANAPWPVTISARALRSVSGTVMTYDPQSGKLQPAQGMDVYVPQLGLRCETDQNGVYTLRNLPPGTFTIAIDGGTPTERQTVTLPADPVTMTGIDFRVTIAQVNRQRRLHERERRRRERGR